MNIEQFRVLTGLLGEIRDRLPAPVDTMVEPQSVRPLGVVVAETRADRLNRRRQALAAVLEVLDSWIEGARDNHDSLGHRTECRGEECWRQFAPEDFRRMVNDAARQVGVREFDYPDIPKEDTL